MKQPQTEAMTGVFESSESNVRYYCRAFPTVFERAKNSYLFDVQGKRYLDFFCGAGALNYGHNPDRIKAKLIDYLNADGIMHALDAYTVAKGRFLERFTSEVLAPRHLDYKVQFCGPTGTNAVEAALKLARKVTGRTQVVAFSGAFHGMSMGSLSVTGSRSTRASAGVPLGHTTFVPFADGPMGPFDSVGYLARMLDDPGSGVDLPAAVIVEAVQCDGGIYPAPAAWLTALRKLCDERKILLICDDIQVGCGRTGRFFSFEHAGIVPDLVTLSKSIGGYGLPMSILLMKREHDRWNPGEHTGTFRGNQLSFVAATAALDYWRDPAFVQALKSNGELLRGKLERCVRHGANLRGVGLVLGLDVSHAGGSERARQISRRCFERGLIVECCGREDTVVKVLPPLTATSDELDEGCAVLEAAFAAG